MNKKLLISIIIFIIIISVISIFFKIDVNTEITDKTEITKLVQDTNLELFLNLGDFDSKNNSEEKLLELAMMYAETNGYLSEFTENNMYIQYISPSELHSIIQNLTNVVIEAPIQIEDFQYRYDSENEYYYCVPIAFPKYEIKNINHVYKNNNSYIFECTATKTEDGQIIDEKNFTTEITTLANSSHTNYQIAKQKTL